MIVVDNDLPDKWEVACAWIDASGTHHEMVFPVVCLDIVRE